MPPRLPSATCQLRQVADCVSYSSHPSSSSLLPSYTFIIPSASRSAPTTQTQRQQSRAFSATAAVEVSTPRRMMWTFLKRQKEFMREPLGTPEDPRPTYIPVGTMRQNSRRPFPLNPLFQSQSVLSEELREHIWEKVMVQGEPMLAVSADLGVDVRRVAAVIRLKEVEKDWVAKKKPLARPYAKAILSMVPQTMPGTKHEPFNEIPVHSFTTQQLFVPVSESRVFTRADAAEAFHRTMLPADERIPHKELVQMERRVVHEGLAPVDAQAMFREATAESERALAAKKAAAVKADDALTTKIASSRGTEFRFKDYNAEDVGKGGRSRRAVGWRYGSIFLDRKKGQVKIPTEVS